MTFVTTNFLGRLNFFLFCLLWKKSKGVCVYVEMKGMMFLCASSILNIKDVWKVKRKFTKSSLDSLAVLTKVFYP